MPQTDAEISQMYMPKAKRIIHSIENSKSKDGSDSARYVEGEENEEKP